MQFILEHTHFSSLMVNHFWLLIGIALSSFLFGAVSMVFVRRRTGFAKADFANTQIIKTERDQASHDRFQQANENAFLSQQIKTVIRNLANSTYVLKDEQNFTSLYQTPLRQNIHHLRLISESLLCRADSAASACQDNELNNKENNQDTHNTYCRPLLVLQRQVETITKLCEQCSIGFSSHLDISPDITVQVSTEWLVSAIHEVLVNAIKQNKHSLKLSISAHTVNQCLVVNIVDDGVGIANAISSQFTENAVSSVHLFRRKSDSENLMNLNLIQDKLLAIGGKILVKSARKFRTQVSLQLPIASNMVTDLSDYAFNKIKTTDTPKLSAGNSSIPRVLWVAPLEQTASNTNSGLLNRLKQTFVVRAEDTIEAALSCIADYRPDCIVIDEDLKANNSFLVQAWVQVTDKFADIPIVTMGAPVDNVTQLRLVQTGITATIEKPVVFCELSSLISNVINEKNKLLNKVEEAIANYHINAMDQLSFEDKETERFLTLFNEILEENFQDYDFRLVEAAKLMHMADKTLSRKISKYYQMKFPDLMKKFRLNKAKALIIQGERVTTVAYQTGFNSPSYFTQCFRAEFGFAPSMLTKERA